MLIVSQRRIILVSSLKPLNFSFKPTSTYNRREILNSGEIPTRPLSTLHFEKKKKKYGAQSQQGHLLLSRNSSSVADTKAFQHIGLGLFHMDIKWLLTLTLCKKNNNNNNKNPLSPSITKYKQKHKNQVQHFFFLHLSQEQPQLAAK